MKVRNECLEKWTSRLSPYLIKIVDEFLSGVSKSISLQLISRTVAPPHISVAGRVVGFGPNEYIVESVSLEWWAEERKLTVYIGEDGASYYRLEGSAMSHGVLFSDKQTKEVFLWLIMGTPPEDVVEN